MRPGSFGKIAGFLTREFSFGDCAEIKRRLFIRCRFSVTPYGPVALAHLATVGHVG